MNAITYRIGTRILFVLASLALLAGCASKPNMVAREKANRIQTVTEVRVEGIRAVTLEGTKSGLGGGAGAVTGALATARHGVVLGILGAVTGAVVGSVAEYKVTQKSATEYTLKTLKTGDTKILVLPGAPSDIRVGEVVKVVETAGDPNVPRLVR